MGGQDSKVQEEDYFVLQHLSKMSLRSSKTVSYYFVHPSTPPLLPLLAQLRTYFKLDHFPELKTLKQEMSFVHRHQIVKVIIQNTHPPETYDYLQNEPKISQVILFGSSPTLPEKYSKIAGMAGKDEDLLPLLNQLEAKDALEIPSSNLLLLIDQDTKMLNKYRLNYHCNTTFTGRNKAKQDLIELAQKLFPHLQDSIAHFQKTYDVALEGELRRKMVREWLFAPGFYWDLTCVLSRSTTDPKRLAYIRLPLKDIYETIFEEFKTQKEFEEMHVVVDVTEEEKAKLDKSKGNFLLFTSFVKGYLPKNEKEANAAVKASPTAFKFTIAPFRSEKLEKSLNFGYLVNRDAPSPNIVFNIYNVFRIVEVNVKTRRAELQYGALPEIFVKRQEEDERGKMCKLDLDLMRNYDYLEDQLEKVDSQATLLQLSGYYKESLEVYDKRVDTIRRSNDSEDNMHRCLIRKGDAFRISGDYASAEKEYLSVNASSSNFHLIAQIHLAELYLLDGQDDKFESIISAITPRLSSLEKTNKEEYLKGSNFAVISNIKKGSLKKAQKRLDELKNQVSILYDYSFEGKPLVHDIYRSLATCKSKMGLHNDALSLLKETLEWQLVCEGKTPNVALTETLIQSVSRSSGNNGELQQSIARLSAMSAQIESGERRFESSVMVGLNRSMTSLSSP